MLLLSHAGIKVNPCCQMSPLDTCWHRLVLFISNGWCHRWMTKIHPTAVRQTWLRLKCRACVIWVIKKTFRSTGYVTISEQNFIISMPAGPRLNIKTVFTGMGISITKIRRSWDRLIFMMEIPFLARRHLDTWDWPQISWHWISVMRAQTGTFLFVNIFKKVNVPTFFDRSIFFKIPEKYCGSSSI